MFNDFDHQMMRRALALAELGRYSTPPNPRVGCVIVQGDRIVGEGWHRKTGEAHAEPIALDAAGDAARGATAYVTLEPHGYHSRTPPCTTALIKAGVSRVICGALDPNPQVNGDGLRQLREAGIAVACGLLEGEVRALNAGFEKRLASGMPRVIVKIAASLDGRVALANGESRWITGELARADVHRLRAEAGAVLTGIDTVLADDPQLTVRDASLDMGGRPVTRVVLDTRLRMPSSARMLREAGETLVFTTNDSPAATEPLQHAGGTPIKITCDADGHVDLRQVLAELGRRQCNDVLVEAGPMLAGSFIAAGLADELIVYTAPVVLGPDARAMLQLPALGRLGDAPRFRLQQSVPLGEDLKLRYLPLAAT